MTELAAHLHWIWIALAFVLAIIEIAIPHFGCVFASGAALISAACAAAHLSWELQLAAFGTSLLASLLLLRPRLVTKLQAASAGVPSRTAKLIGAEGRVTSETDTTTGLARASFTGDDWAVRSNEASLAVGDMIRVENADGIVLIVKKKT